MMTDAQAAALVAAGRILQSRHWSPPIKIEKTAGESYPEAVLRTIGGLTKNDRARLRELVVFVREYEEAE